jgi:poly(hydroxyalkanoate) granule-associated protein
MVKKIQKSAEKKSAEPPELQGNPLAQTVKDSAQQIWLAGLGAFAKAQDGGGKVFDTLIKEGVNLQRKTQSVAEEKLGDVAGRMTAMAGEVGHKANAQWDKLESIFEERTARALGKLGVPNAKELAALSARVEALAAAVARLGGQVDESAQAKPARRSGGRAKRAASTAVAAAAVEPTAAFAAPASPFTDPPTKPARKSARAPQAKAAGAAPVARKRAPRKPVTPAE